MEDSPINDKREDIALQLLLARLDLKTERLLAEAEAIVIDYANIELQLAVAEAQ